MSPDPEPTTIPAPVWTPPAVEWVLPEAPATPEQGYGKSGSMTYGEWLRVCGPSAYGTDLYTAVC